MYLDSRVVAGIGAAIAAVVVAALLILNGGGPGGSVTKQEADIIVVDRTSDHQAWGDAQAALLERTKHAFGQVVIDGKIIGEGATGNVTVLPVGSNTNITSTIPVLDYQALTNFRDEDLYGDNTVPRIKTIYRSLLSGDSDSLWVALVDNQIGNNASAFAGKSDCQTVAKSEITKRKNESTDFEAALGYISVKTSESKLADLTCGLIADIARGLKEVDSKMNQPSPRCQNPTSGGEACSDILGAAKTISIILNDIKRIEGEDEEGNRTQVNACVLFASDMMHYASDGPLKIKTWDIGQDEPNEASAEGEAFAGNVLGSGFPSLDGGMEVYMPYLGSTTYNRNRTTHEINELEGFWKSFFAASNADVLQGSAGSACTGDETQTVR